MKKVARLAAGLVLATLPLLSSGCGAGNSTNFSPAGPQQVFSAAPLSGRVFLGADVPGARVQVLSSSGALLAETTTREDGSFYIGDFLGTESFRVTARVADYLFATEVRGYAGRGRYVVVNVPTSLVSGYLQQNPGASLAQAEAQVAAALQISGGRSLEYGIEESVRAPFSHIAFFQAAVQAGGWPNFRERLLAQASGSASPLGPFVLTRQVGRTALTGLDASLLNPLETFRTSTFLRRQLASNSAHPLARLNRILNEGPTSFSSGGSTQVQGKVLSTIVDTVAEGAKEQLIDVGWTHIADALNLNYGTTRMLEVIQDQLIEVTYLLTELNTKVSEYNLQQANNSLNAPVATIKSLTSQLSNINGGTDGVGGTPAAGQTSGTDLANPGTPYVAPSDVSQLISSMAGFAALDALTQIEAEMLGTGGTTNILTANRDQINGELGLVGSSSTGNAPVRNNVIIEEILTSHDYYANLQQMACTILGETSHVSNSNPVTSMVNAAGNISNAVDSLKQQRGQLPQYLDSDQVVVDLQGGLMWYYKTQAATSFTAANSTADNFKLTVGNITYDDWRLPSDEECSLLQDRGRLCSHRDTSEPTDGSNSAYGNYGYTLTGLPGLGFEPNSLKYIDSDGDIWALDWQIGTAPADHGQWLYSYGTFGMNHEHTPFGSANHDHAFMMVRNIGEPVIDEDSKNQGYNSDHTYPYVWTAARPEEFVTLGSVTAVGNGQIAAGKAGATVTYSLQTGGSFSMGNSSSGDSRSFASRSYTQQVDTYPGGSHDYAGTHNLYEIVRFLVSAGSSASIGSDGDIYWHNQQANANLTVPFTVSVLNMAGSVVSGSGSLVQNNAPVRTLQTIQTFPMNRKYDMTTTASRSENYTCAAYYSDGTVEDVTSSATWSVTAGQGASASAHFSTSQPNELILNNTATETVTVTVTYGGQSFSAPALVYNN